MMIPSHRSRFLPTLAIACASVVASAATSLPWTARATTPAPVQATGSAPFLIIVNPNNPVTSIDSKFLLDLFLRRVTRWPDGQSISAADLPPSSPTRQRFSDQALGRPVSSVKGYWLQAIFSGHNIPPPQLDSDEQVVRFVARTRGGIGYVSGATHIAGVRVISVR